MGPFSLSGETALITGGATGIGFGIGRSFIEAGAKVVLAGRRENELKRACAELGPAAFYQCCDITETKSLHAMLAAAARQAGHISILVNNAGIHLKKPAIDTTEHEMQEVVSTHLLSAFQLTRLAARDMLHRRHGSILWIASMASLLGLPLVSAYTIAKTGIVGAVRALAAELSPHGVRVNAIAPGWIETPMLRKALHGDAKREARILERTPMGRFGETSDIGWAAVYLCSPGARFTTGVVLPVDGGASIGF